MEVNDIRHIAVVGAGLMGHGIALEFALAGFRVHLHDITQEKLQQSLTNINDDLQMLVKLGCVTGENVEPVLANIHISNVLNSTVEGVDVVIESVPEDLQLKQHVFHELDRLCQKHTILASNTSTFTPSNLASKTLRPDKVLVTHFFNPPYLLPLVEIVRGKETSSQTITIIFDLLKKVGKSPVIVQKEIPGFIANRLQAALFREAVSIVNKGIASPEDVDRVIKHGFGRRYASAGVFELADIAGLDVGLAMIFQLFSNLESAKETPSLVREKVERGEIGVKAGKGFYPWTPESANALKQRIAHALVEIRGWSAVS